MEDTVLTSEQKELLIAKMHRRRGWYARGRRLFNWAHHLALFLSIILSATAAIVPQLKGYDEVNQKNVASILAGLAAVLLTFDTTGGFSTKWRVFRFSATKIDQLENELIKRPATTADVDKLSQIEEEHAKGVTGG